eukprot:2155780-Rhodomonas_salina.1
MFCRDPPAAQRRAVKLGKGWGRSVHASCASNPLATRMRMLHDAAFNIRLECTRQVVSVSYVFALVTAAATASRTAGDWIPCCNMHCRSVVAVGITSLAAIIALCCVHLSSSRKTVLLAPQRVDIAAVPTAG